MRLAHPPSKSEDIGLLKPCPLPPVGTPRANVDDAFSVWVNAIVGQFEEHIGWEG
jgi:hypothetical protein